MSDDLGWREFDEWARLPDRFDDALRLGSKLPLSAITPDGRTTLHLAAAAGADLLALALVDLGADPFAQANDGWTPTRSAAMSGSHRFLSSIVVLDSFSKEEACAALDAALGGLGRHRVVAKDPSRAIQTIQMLLDAGADPRQRRPTDSSNTLAQAAGVMLLRRTLAVEIHLQVLAAFVAHGVSIAELFEDAENDPLALAVDRESDPALISFFVENGLPLIGRTGKASALHALARKDAAREQFEWWIARGSELELRDARGETPLLEAASHRAINALRALLELGANRHAVNNDGDNALSIALARRDAAELVEFLRESGVSQQPTKTRVSDTASEVGFVAPAGARRAKIKQGPFASFDVHVVLRADGSFDAHINMFGRSVVQIIAAGEFTLLDE